MKKIFLPLVFLLIASSSSVSAAEKFSLSMFHFNIQYVAGGLEGFPGSGVNPATGDELEDQIIVESFLPLLDLLEDHPDWALTLEFQGYMLQIIAERFPEDLARLKALAEAGRAELVSLHYSDQFFLAYPKRDLEKSIELTKQVYAENEIPHSGVIFTQEGQFGVGLCSLAAETGYTVLGLPKNLYRYLHWEDELKPWWDCEGMTVVPIGQGFSLPEIEVNWNFFNDGELLMTGEANPYLGPAFVFSQSSYNEYEARLQAMADDGYRISTIADYTAQLKSINYPKPALPPMLDGDWQPKDTYSIWFWMGRVGLWPQDENDNEILTTNYKNSVRLRALETLADDDKFAARYGDADLLAEELDGIWRKHALACVSDSTGQRPFIGEVDYSRNLAAEVAAAIELLAETLVKNTITVDLGAGEILNGDKLIDDAPSAVDNPPLDLVVTSGFREHEIRWSRYAAADRWRLDIDFAGGAGRDIKIAFPRFADEIEYSPALTDRVEVYDLADFNLQPDGPEPFNSGWFILPTSNGLLGLGDGWYVIKQNRSVHLAAHTHPSVDQWWFENQTAEPEAVTYSFEIIKGDAEDALALANRINVTPRVLFEGNAVAGGDSDDSGGCACNAAADAAGPPLALLIILLPLTLIKLSGKQRRRN